ncbi:MAG TPA: RNase adapter RapZ [Acidobacteriota bacterium]|nr:RNase adapter RapZ [Acidobacteriota bacterium]
MSLQDLVVVTGMSGSGKGTVLKAFEDLGFFCIDNLPVVLIPKFIEGIHSSGSEITHAALVIDIRAGEKLNDLEEAIWELRKPGFRLFILYLEAREDVLVRRFSETRRPHPLSAAKPIREAIRLERKRLQKLRDLADLTIDTSDCTVHRVKALVAERFRRQPRASILSINLMSFGYKNGIPLEADLVFDARFLPNPYFVSRLKALSGRDRKIVSYLRSFPEAKEFVKRVGELLEYLLPKYMQEGKSYLTIAVGCTGGRHRSVFVVEELAKFLKNKKRAIHVRHRDENA